MAGPVDATVASSRPAGRRRAVRPSVRPSARPPAPPVGDTAEPIDERIAPGWLLALMAANTVAAIGLFGDIARHVSLASDLSGADFLSGWHLVLYGGVLGVAVVLGAFAVAHGPRAPLQRLPAASAGLVTLTLGGLADAAWHEAFGVEAAFEALVSPPHLAVFAGLVLLMVAPIGAVAAGPARPIGAARSLVLALSITSLLLVISLFTGYLTPLIGGSELQAGAYLEPLVGTSYLDQDTARGLAVTLWFGFVVAVVVTVVRARTAPLAGTWTIAFGLLGVAPLVASGSVALPIAGALLVYGLLSDLTACRRPPNPLATGAAVAAMWAMMFAVIAGRDQLLWGRELWGGVITTGFLVGAAVCGTVRWLTGPLGGVTGEADPGGGGWGAAPPRRASR